jgi:predicted small secreted protein
MFKKIFIGIFITALLISSAGCNTVHGVGKDIGSVGESIQKSSK